MTIEDRLRETLAAQADTVRAVDDPAGRAIRRGQAVRRRRSVGSGLAAAVCAVLVLTGAVWAQARLLPAADGSVAGPHLAPDAPVGRATRPAPAPRPEPTAGIVAPKASPVAAPAGVRTVGLDLRVGAQLWTVTGRRLPLSGVGQVVRVYRIPAGWIYGGADQVRLLRPDGSSEPLGRLGPDWVVGPDGARLAYVRDGRLVVHRIDKRGLAAGVTAAVPDDARPTAIVGTRVVVSSGDGSYAVVVPGGAARPVWNRAVLAVYGALGGDVAALVAYGGEACLALLEPDRALAVLRRGSCRPRAQADPKAVLAPDGGWLAELGDDGAVLRRFDRAVRDAPAAVACPVGDDARLAWVDAGTLAAAADGRVTLCRIDRSVVTVRLPDRVDQTAAEPSVDGAADASAAVAAEGDWALVPAYAPPAGD
jgi:hypothetical protein